MLNPKQPKLSICLACSFIDFLFDFWCFNAFFSNISAISWRPVFSGGGSRSTRREPPTLGMQLVSLATASRVHTFL